MKLTIDDIRKLLQKKEQIIESELDKKKIENLKFLLKRDNAFFNMDINVAIGVLAYLGIPKEHIKEVYFELISPSNYIKTSKPYVSIINS